MQSQLKVSTIHYMQLIYYTTLFPGNRPVRYYDNIVYRDIFSNIAIRYFLLNIAITAIEKCVLKVEAQAQNTSPCGAI